MLVVEEPFVGTKVAVEPHCVIETGHHQIVVAASMGQRRGIEERHVGRVGEQTGMKHLIVRERSGGVQPDLLVWWQRFVAVERVSGDVAHVESGHSAGVGLAGGCESLGAGGQRLGGRNVGHRIAMLEAFFTGVERGGHVKDRSPMLNGHNSSRCEGAPVADPVDLVQDRDPGVTGSQKVRMEGVDGAVVVDGAGRGDQRLASNQAAKRSLSFFVGLCPAKDVDLDWFEVKQAEQGGDRVRHLPIMPAACCARTSTPVTVLSTRGTMTLTSAPVTPAPSQLAKLVATHGTKVFRYCGVSVVNVIVGQGILAFCLAVLDFSAIVSQFWSAMLSAIPAYILSKRWVWKQTGSDSFRSEVLPFWIMAAIGLGFALIVVGVTDRVTDSTPVLMLSSLGAYGIVWVAKYLVLDQLMWKVTPSGVESEAL